MKKHWRFINRRASIRDGWLRMAKKKKAVEKEKGVIVRKSEENACSRGKMVRYRGLCFLCGQFVMYGWNGTERGGGW